MAGAAGGFVTRSFESMLKESKKHIALQKAIQAYLGLSAHCATVYFFPFISTLRVFITTKKINNILLKGVFKRWLIGYFENYGDKQETTQKL